MANRAQREVVSKGKGDVPRSLEDLSTDELKVKAYDTGARLAELQVVLEQINRVIATKEGRG